ncbi:MAG: hypothetical protein IKR27_09455 [Lachnospiraceae bacterium]|nr:hypothetical protein [Lachnospiraceae bacterium]
MKKKYLKPLLFAGCLALLCGCGQKAGEKATTGDADRFNPVESSTEEATKESADKAESSSASASSADEKESAEPTATPTEAAPTEIPTYEQSWTYQIVPSGYYNACAKWDDDGNLVEGPEYAAGKQIYYNDCDEYYDNFVATDNVFGKAIISLDDSTAHSCDNSIKITGRVQESGGFSGFGFKLAENNILDIEQLQDKEVTLGFWVYYDDDFSTGVADTMTFAIWSNLNVPYDKENEQKTVEPAYVEKTDEMTDDEKKEIDINNQLTKKRYEKACYEELVANKNGFYKLKEMMVERKTWRYFEVTTKIDVSTMNRNTTVPMFAFATLGETNATNLTFYNPFYIDDIILTLND